MCSSRLFMERLFKKSEVPSSEAMFEIDRAK
jgi:hypothetical protein